MIRSRLAPIGVILALITFAPLAFAQTKRPNVVIILADDLGSADLGCYGSTFYETPNLDRLATQGIRFTNSYSSCQVCSPARASLMTGQFPARVGLTNYIPGSTRGKLIPAPFLDHLPLELPNLPRTLHDAGYATWHLGKWHLGNKDFSPAAHGFDVTIGTEVKGGKRSNFSPFHLEGLEDGTEGKFITDALADAAIKLIQDNKDKPFYLNLWTYAPHVPIQSPPELIEKYKAKAKAMGLDENALRKDENFPIENKRNQRVTRRLVQSNPVYAGMIENLDTNIGRVLKAIDDAGQADNTIVIFASDNGGLSTAEGSPTVNGPFSQGKGWMYEGGIRVPLIVRWPGQIKAGTTSDTPVVTADYFPTLLDATGVARPANAKFDGVSFLPVLKDPAAPLQRDAIYWHYPHYGNQGGSPAAAVREGDWKLIELFEGPRFELYNVKADLGEKNDLAASEPQRVEKLKTMLETWQKEVGAKFPTPNPDFGKAVTKAATREER
jgi:arylsulfatase A-like enzyme